jgi:hypothetical protein
MAPYRFLPACGEGRGGVMIHFSDTLFEIALRPPLC